MQDVHAHGCACPKACNTVHARRHAILVRVQVVLYPPEDNAVISKLVVVDGAMHAWHCMVGERYGLMQIALHARGSTCEGGAAGGLWSWHQSEVCTAEVLC
jgi:hypothetical protein